METAGTQKFFRSWENRTPQIPKYYNYWPHPIPWFIWYMPHYFSATTQLVGATPVSTPNNDQTALVDVSTTEGTAPQASPKKRKRDAEDAEDREKAERDEYLKKRIFQLSPQQIEAILPYRREMARTFAPKQRTPAEQRKRNKNTEACRLSRRRKKLMEAMKEYPEAFRR